MTTTIGLSRMTIVSGGLSYFDHRFTELKQLLVRKDEGKREIEHIKSSLGEILTRLEQIAADLPSGRSLEFDRYEAQRAFRIAGRGGWSKPLRMRTVFRAQRRRSSPPAPAYGKCP